MEFTLLGDTEDWKNGIGCHGGSGVYLGNLSSCGSSQWCTPYTSRRVACFIYLRVDMHVPNQNIIQWFSISNKGTCINGTGDQLFTSSDQGLFGTQEFHRNHMGISQESVQFHKKNAGMEKKSRIPNRPSMDLVNMYSKNKPATSVNLPKLMQSCLPNWFIWNK